MFIKDPISLRKKQNKILRTFKGKLHFTPVTHFDTEQSSFSHFVILCCSYCVAFPSRIMKSKCQVLASLCIVTSIY